MLSYLEVVNYRGFEKFRMDNLKRVNLLTGRNNSGKTALLEAVQLLISGGDPRVIVDIAKRRGEISALPDTESWSQYGRFGCEILRLFNGHKPIQPNGPILSAGNSPGFVLVMALGDDRWLYEQAYGDVAEDMDYHQVLIVSATKILNNRQHCDYILTDNYLFPERFNKARLDRPTKKDTYLSPPWYWIGLSGTSSRELDSMWGNVVKTGREELVLGAIQILYPGIKSIVFAPRGDTDYSGYSGGFYLGVEEGSERLPIGSFGEGMTRMLTLALALASCANGFLLIDEIDTGLHYSVMDDMWKLVIKTAQELDVQVFATTHSQDCVRGLADLCEDSTDLANEVSIQKIDPRLKHSIDSEATNLALMLEHHVEVR